MTEIEAIKEFKERIELIEKCYRGEAGDYKEVLEIGVKALEKRIPKKVQEKHIDEYICPACGEENSGCDEGKITDRYCPKCGQRLEW